MIRYRNCDSLTECVETAEADSRPKSAHRYNVAEQQTVYKSEIERIWKAQFDSLSRKDEPQLTQEDEERGAVQKLFRSRGKMEDFDTPIIASSPSAVSPPPATRPSAPPSPTFSRGSSLDRDMSLGPEGSQRVLRIKRMVCFMVLISFFLLLIGGFPQVDGEWETEIVRDSAVIRAYVRRRQLLEEEATLADSLAPTGDEEKDRRAKKRSAARSIQVHCVCIHLCVQTRGRDCTYEEEPRASTPQKECQDRQRRRYADATQPADEAGHNSEPVSLCLRLCNELTHLAPREDVVTVVKWGI